MVKSTETSVTFFYVLDVTALLWSRFCYHSLCDHFRVSHDAKFSAKQPPFSYLSFHLFQTITEISYLFSGGLYVTKLILCHCL